MQEIIRKPTQAMFTFAKKLKKRHRIIVNIESMTFDECYKFIASHKDLPTISMKDFAQEIKCYLNKNDDVEHMNFSECSKFINDNIQLYNITHIVGKYMPMHNAISDDEFISLSDDVGA